MKVTMYALMFTFRSSGEVLPCTESGMVIHPGDTLEPLIVEDTKGKCLRLIEDGHWFWLPIEVEV